MFFGKQANLPVFSRYGGADRMNRGKNDQARFSGFIILAPI
jgi:hypothetical protein